MPCVVMPVVADQRVDQRRFADARRADQRNGAAAAAPGQDIRDALGVARVEHLDQQSGQKLRCGAGIIPGRVGEIGLGQHHDRRDFGFAGQCEVALEPRQVEILVAGRNDEQRIDIGRDQLQPAVAACRAALEQALTPKQALRSQGDGVEKQPVAHRGRGFGICRIGRKWRYVEVDAGGGNMNAVAMHCHDPHGAQRCKFVGVRLSGKKGSPAEVGQRGSVGYHWFHTSCCATMAWTREKTRS